MLSGTASTPCAQLMIMSGTEARGPSNELVRSVTIRTGVRQNSMASPRVVPSPSSVPAWRARLWRSSSRRAACRRSCSMRTTRSASAAARSARPNTAWKSGTASGLPSAWSTRASPGSRARFIYATGRSTASTCSPSPATSSRPS